MHRRDFLLAGAGMLAGLALAQPRARPWGLQLFTVLDPLELDFEGTLKAVAAIGYREVETIGAFGRDPGYVRDLLDKYGLHSPSQHIASKALYDTFAAWARKQITSAQVSEGYTRMLAVENAMAVVEEGVRNAKVLGQRHVIWPILFEAHLQSREMLDHYLAIFNAAGDLCAKEGLRFAFHNHHREFARLDGQVIYDLILAGTSSERVKMEMDFYWFAKAKADPLAYLAKHPGRFCACHVKDATPAGDFTTVGRGVLDLPKLIGAARGAGVEHFYVEYDRSADPLKEVREAYAYLSRLTA